MRRIPRKHIVLFIVTLLSMLVAGLPGNVNLFQQPWRIYEGAPFAASLMIILLAHEFSHYFTARRHHTEATLPYFLPAPPLISPIGTFGAFIKMKSPITTRSALIDIGASGPISGFILSVVACIVGLSLSTIVISPAESKGLVIDLGDSLLFKFLSEIMFGKVPDGYDLLLHPVAFAGWIGLFVTSLNLIPIGQLDGGHVVYAFLGKKHAVLSGILVVVLFAMGLLGIFQEATGFSPSHFQKVVPFIKSTPDFWPGWALWGAIMLALRLKHPPVIYWEPLDKRRRITGVLALVIFVITFIPSPFKIS